MEGYIFLSLIVIALILLIWLICRSLGKSVNAHFDNENPLKEEKRSHFIIGLVVLVGVMGAYHGGGWIGQMIDQYIYGLFD
ncbi:hypothetical protein [Curvivirga sp.]|uniref:hypothetical protein n=1 Tax=Curvivirga sp. TaxID=2856848 RepID=UPI003B5CF5CA